VSCSSVVVHAGSECRFLRPVTGMMSMLCRKVGGADRRCCEICDAVSRERVR
jgi:hypothetical protein